MKFASVLMSALLLIAPDLTRAAGPASRPAGPNAWRTGATYVPRSKAEVLVKQFELLAPAGTRASVRVEEASSGPPVVGILGESQSQVQRAAQALEELDNVAVGAAQETRAFQLRHARAREAEEALRGLLRSREVTISRDERTNRVLVSANEAQLKRAGELVQLLDVPGEEKPELRTNIYSVRHANLDTLTGPLGLLMPEGGGAFALDPPSRQVIVQGTPKMLEQVEALLAKLDVPPPATKPAEGPQAIQIRLIWLTTLPTSHPEDPPKDMIDVLAELQRIGVRPLRLVTQMVVPAVVGQDFNISGAASLDRPVELKITGVVASADMLQVQLGVRGEAERAGKPSSGGAPGYIPPKVFTDLVSIQTTVVAPPSQSVVLGVSSQEDHQDVFIIQVRQVGK